MSASNKKKLRKEQNAQVMTERQKKERAEAKKTKSMTIAFVAAIALILCIFIGTVGVTLFNSFGVMERLTTAATVGDHKINSIVMNYFYYDAVEDEYARLQEAYGEYASYFIGYDPSKPLSEQKYDESGKTWGDHYMDVAADNAKAIYSVYDHAMANGFEITKEVEDLVAANMQQITIYESLGYSTKSMLRNIYGAGANMKSYEKYITMKVVASYYYQQHQDSLEYTADEINAYNDEHFNEFSSYDFYSHYVACDDYLTGGTVGEDDKVTYSDEEKEAARAAAEAAAQTLLSATNLEELNAAIAALNVEEEPESTEPEATEPEATEPEATEPEATEADATEPEATEAEEEVPTAELNSDLDHTNLPEDYAKWLGDAERKSGDIEVFPSTSTDADGKETVNGYYVLMYQARDDKNDLMANIRQILIVPEGGETKDGVTTYTEEEWAAAKQKADDLLAKWNAGSADDASFAALVESNSKDYATATTGGLYENVHEDFTGLATEVLTWTLDEARKAEDTAVIKSSNGYYIVYFVGDDDQTYRQYRIEQALIAADMTEWETTIVDAVEVVRGDESKINKDLILQPASN